jgi:hypothetical protein
MTTRKGESGKFFPSQLFPSISYTRGSAEDLGGEREVERTHW